MKKDRIAVANKLNIKDERNIMTKNFSVTSGKCKTLLWLALPLALAAGCASDPGRVAKDRASPLEPLPQQTGYASSRSRLAVDGGVRAEAVAPVSDQQAAVGSEIFDMMLADKSYGYPLWASVDKSGVVRLGGTSINGIERQRMVDRMWELPGVTGVKDKFGYDVAHTVAQGVPLIH